MSKSWIIIFQTLFFFMSSWLAIIWTANPWSPLTTCVTSLPVQSCLLKASHSWSHFSAPCNLLWILFTSQKHVLIIWCYLYTLSETLFRVEFSPTRWKFSGLFIPQCSLLNNLKKKRSKQKHMKRNLQLLQKTNITVIL